MSRNYFSVGVVGEIARRIQTALTEAGFDTKGTDGWFGNNTAIALGNFQQSKQLSATGMVDEATWQQLMAQALPSVADRSLELTAAFEGHGFGLAVGNFDGALLTWGIIGFTMGSGEVQHIINAVQQQNPQLVNQAFQDSTQELLDLVNESADFQTTWANAHTLPNGGLVQPWRQMFATFGSFPEVQAEQMKHVVADYLNPAIATGRKLKLTSELGLALCFDIHVQNGGIKLASMAQIQQNTTSTTTETDLLAIIANTVADSARPDYREDVRRRKLTIAQGQGDVHGHTYVLDNWGLNGGFSAAELMSASAATNP